jgi:hypothetical protein
LDVVPDDVESTRLTAVQINAFAGNPQLLEGGAGIIIEIDPFATKPWFFVKQ